MYSYLILNGLISFRHSKFIIIEAHPLYDIFSAGGRVG
jgi:hypothetical protein